MVKPGPSLCLIVRIDANQGVHGVGQVRDGARPACALFLKAARAAIAVNAIGEVFLRRLL